MPAATDYHAWLCDQHVWASELRRWQIHLIGAGSEILEKDCHGIIPALVVWRATKRRTSPLPVAMSYQPWPFYSPFRYQNVVV